MIAINPDRSLMRVATWEEIEQIVGFTPNLDLKDCELGSIITPYHLTYLVPCGLKSCHKKHFNGYIVVTKDGRVTNMGKDCGFTHFGVIFTTMVTKLERDLRDAERRDKLHKFQRHIDEHLSTLTEMKKEPKGANWIYFELGVIKHHERGLPVAIRRVLDDVVRTQSPVLKRQRLQTAQEAFAAGLAKNPSVDQAPDSRDEGDEPHRVMISEEVGTLNGISVLFEENNLRNLLSLDMEEGLKELQALVVDKASTHQLGKWAKWVGEFDKKLAKGREIIEAGRLFLERVNIAQLAEVAVNEEDKKRVLQIARRY